MPTRAQAGDPVAIDVAYLATTYAISEADLEVLLHNPSIDLIQSLFTSLTETGQEFDALKTAKLKVDVELESTVRTAETKVKAQKAAVARHVKESEELRTKSNESEAARQVLANELEQLRSLTSSSSTETQVLRQRIETLEASNRDALALVESKSSEKDRLATELSEQHSKLLALRRDVSQLEEHSQALENAASSQKFKEQSLHQELDMIKRNNDWHVKELQTRAQEHATFRKERNARVSQLERDLDESNANVETLKRSETALRKRLDELQAKTTETLAKHAGLEELLAKKDQDFRTELSSSKRLAELQAQNAATHRARLLEVENEFEQSKDDIREEISRLQTEVETERMDKEEAERKLAELELKVEDLEQRAARPGTPRRNAGLDPVTPGRSGARLGSPAALPGSLRKSVNGLSFTQLYSRYMHVQEELEAEKRRTDELTVSWEQALVEMEGKGPEIEERVAEIDRLQDELLTSSRLTDEANESRKHAVEEAQEARGKLDAAIARAKILEQQCRDLSAQVKMLLVEIQSRDAGLDQMSAEERIELERAARGELDDATLEGMTDTGRLISERLVIFRDVAELQSKYQDALEITRRLGDGKEALEAMERETAEKARETDELRQTIQRYKDELKATATQMESYVKERDMFRRMLQHRGQLGADGDMQAMFSQSHGPSTPQRNSMEPPATPRSKDLDDLNKLVKDQQKFFDQYRTEWTTDRRILSDQIDSLGRDKSALQAEFAREKSQRTLSDERYSILESSFNGLRNENNELQKRSQHLMEHAARQDIRTQQVAEDLVEARSLADSLRNENANSKAEKELWKRIEARLTEDNKTLMDERSRLNKHVTDLQNMQNERELADSETRRRLQSRAEALESELGQTQRKLQSELEESRKANQRREFEENQSRTRIDDLVKSLGNVREELAAAKTTRDQLQARVDELKIELRSAEEKVTALQPRPTPRPGAGQNGEQQSNDDNLDLPEEQRLALEASTLRRDLNLTKTELENAKQQVTQFQAIAQSTEEDLAAFTETTDQYKEETERVLSEKDVRIKELSQRVEDLISELATSNAELSELRLRADSSDRLLAEQKTSLEAEITRLRDDVDRHAEEKKLFQEDIKAQAEIAQQAQQSYEDELVKHAEAAKSLQNVRKEYNDLRTEIASLQAEAETARASLERNEDSWSEQRERFERELDEAKRKRRDVDEQNKILHQNLDSFSNELAALRQGRTIETGSEGSPTAVSHDSNSQEIIRYLRREKEIVDVQYELSIQEAKRLQQQLDYTDVQLEETRQKLNQERREHAEQANTEGSTTKLAQAINELNLYRESVTTLRNEAKQAREKLQDKCREVERLIAEIEPLKGRVGELEGEMESKEGEIKLLQDDRDHWRERTQNIISKYDRVDPAELEELRKQLEALKTEKETLQNEVAPLHEQIASFDSRLESEKTTATQELRDRLDKFKTQAKEQDRKRQERIRDITVERDNSAEEAEKVKTELAVVTTQLDQAKAALEEFKANASSANEAEEGQVDEGDSSTDPQAHAALHAKIAEAESSASEHSNRANALGLEVQTLQTRVTELESQATELQNQLEAAQTNPANPENGQLKQDLASAQMELEELRSNPTSAPSLAAPVTQSNNGDSQSSPNDVEAAVAQLRKEMEQQHSLAIGQMEESHSMRIENMKANLRRQLAEGREKQREALRQEMLTEHSAEIQRLKDEHAVAVEQLRADHRAEIERLTKEGAAAASKADQSQSSEVVKVETAPTAIDSTKLELSETDARALIKNNATIHRLLQSNVRSHVEKQTEKLRATIAEKDEQIAKLEEALNKAPPGEGAQIDGDMISRAEMEQKIQALVKEKDAAVRQAVETVEKKTKAQMSMRDLLNAKIAAVRKAAHDTPAKPVKEVWDVADKARPLPPKPAPTTGTLAASSPPSLPNKPVMNASPSQAKASPASLNRGPNSQSAELAPASANADSSKEAAPIQNKPAAADNSTIANGVPPKPAQSGIPAPGSKLPRAGSLQSQGAPGQNTQSGAQRGSHQASGIARGGATGRGGRGNARGGPAANAGQKRQHDGAGDGGDAKRTRGGGAS